MLFIISIQYDRVCIGVCIYIIYTCNTNTNERRAANEKTSLGFVRM